MHPHLAPETDSDQALSREVMVETATKTDMQPVEQVMVGTVDTELVRTISEVAVDTAVMEDTTAAVALETTTKIHYR